MATSTTARLWSKPARRRGRSIVCMAILTAAFGTASVPAMAQTSYFQFEQRPQLPKKPQPPTDQKGDKQMLVQAREVVYDHVNDRVSAVGNVQIYFNGSTVEADKVTYNQKTKRLRAEGRVRLTEPGGNVTHGEILELNDDYRDGFVDSLRLETPDATRFAAARAERSEGNYTVLQSGVYTACEACKEDPKKPPLWQVKAARIVHDEGEKMIHFEQAQLEFFGKPIAYFPYLSAPDPTVKRKSGFLMPTFGAGSGTGFTVEMPYFWALAPNYDVTLTPTITTRQGPLMQAEFRQRLMNGSYAIRGAGIYQLDKDYFKTFDSGPWTGETAPGYRDWRGSIESAGQFALNQRWVWGWDALLVSDRTFYQNYNLSTMKAGNRDPFKTGSWTGTDTGVSQLYLNGAGNRSYFDVRAIHYYGFSMADHQDQLPVVHPVMDYFYTFDKPILGGEVNFKSNFTSLTRDQAAFDGITAAGRGTIPGRDGICDKLTPDTAVKDNCLMRGMPGTYTRASAEVNWERKIVDNYGQIFKPFFSLRGDAAAVNVKSQAFVSEYIDTNDDTIVRGMPTAGLEYRYPLINVQSWGTQTIEPIAQVIARPNENRIGRTPNEDAQSLVFDDTNLFRVDKFSGWDRTEGGGRANVGMQYTAQFNQGGFINALFGQSYHLFGTNSFAAGDATNTGLDSGLDTTRSDYVARLSYQPDRIYTFNARARLDESNFDLQRFEIEARANYDRWSVSALYGNYAAQPLLGFLERREGVLGALSLKLTPNWVLQTAARYDIDAEKFNQTRIGVGYVDDCLILGLNYITSYDYSGNVDGLDHRIMLQLSLRTLGDFGVSTSVNDSPGGL